MEYVQISIKPIKSFCNKLLTKGYCTELPFHNLEHTKEVVANVMHIGKAMKVSKKDLFILETAAWFHDTGFSNCYKGHEDSSQKIATAFLSKEGMSKRDIKTICSCIEATKMPQNPQSDLAKILCDADLFHIATSQFFYRKLLLRREWEIFCDINSSDLEWHKLNLAFLKNHSFHTTYGCEVLEQKKRENLKKVINILKYY